MALDHPIVAQSFEIIDQEIGTHNFNSSEYAILRRIIHTTADFEFTQLLKFSPGAIESGINALSRQIPIVTDVSMVRMGIATMTAKTFGNHIFSAVEQVKSALPGKTKTETGLVQLFRQYPEAVYVIGNAPTALLALCSQLSHSPVKPPLIIGVPVGFVAVQEAKLALAQTCVPHIMVQGRKGGSPVAAAILNALLVLAWKSREVK